MGRAPCCDKANVKRGPWSPEEDATLKHYLETHGTGGNWITLPQKAGLRRCGKSCRLRWLNYLRPDIRHGGFTENEDNVIITLFNNIGSRWSVIASHLPGRTDNDVKNYWNTKLKKKLLAAAKSSATPMATTPQSSSTTTVTTTLLHAPSLVRMEDLSTPQFVDWTSSTFNTNLYSEFTTPLPLPLPFSLPYQQADQDSSAASSSVDNWSANGGCGSGAVSSRDDAFLSDFGFDSYSEFLTAGYSEIAAMYSSTKQETRIIY